MNVFEVPRPPGIIDISNYQFILEEEYPGDKKWKVVSKSTIKGLCTRGFISDKGRVVTVTHSKSGPMLLLDKTNLIQEELLELDSRNCITALGEQMLYNKKTSDVWLAIHTVNHSNYKKYFKKYFEKLPGIARIYIESGAPDPLLPDWVQIK